MPDDRPTPPNPVPEGRRNGFASGVWDHDVLPETDLGHGVSAGPVELSLDAMSLGRDSWTGRSLKLLAEWGPFRLAYLEAVLRAADTRASAEEATRARD